jgi:soluble lytic murein transglycosylase-like protein
MGYLRQLACLILVTVAAAGAHAAEVAVLQNGFEIRHERHLVSGDTTRLYLDGTSDSGYIDVPSSQIVDFRHEESTPSQTASPPATGGAKLSPEDIHKLVSDASTRHSIDPDLIASVIHAESNFNPNARSPKGAQGLMQLMPGTASRLGVSDAFQPGENIDAGTRYLRQLLLRYDDDMVKALAAYNAGPERVEQYHGIPPYAETHAYVARVIRDFNRKKEAQGQAVHTARVPGRHAVPNRKAVHKSPAAAHSTLNAKTRPAPAPSTAAIEAGH